MTLSRLHMEASWTPRRDYQWLWYSVYLPIHARAQQTPRDQGCRGTHKLMVKQNISTRRLSSIWDCLSTNPSMQKGVEEVDKGFPSLFYLGSQVGYCYTLCNTTPELQSLLPPNPTLFQDPYCISLLTSNLNSIFRTPYIQPCPTLPVPCPFLATLTEASVIPSQTYSSPCCACNPA